MEDLLLRSLSSEPNSKPGPSPRTRIGRSLIFFSASNALLTTSSASASCSCRNCKSSPNPSQLNTLNRTLFEVLWVSRADRILADAVTARTPTVHRAITTRDCLGRATFSVDGGYANLVDLFPAIHIIVLIGAQNSLYAWVSSGAGGEGDV